MLIVINAVFKVVDLVIQINERFSDSLEGDHQFSLSLDSLFVLMLVPDLFPLVEVTDFSPEVAMWHISVMLVSVWVVNWVVLTCVYRYFTIFTMWARLMMIDWLWLMIDWLRLNVVAVIKVRVCRRSILNTPRVDRIVSVVPVEVSFV
jgi:hypothetical protein